MKIDVAGDGHGVDHHLEIAKGLIPGTEGFIVYGETETATSGVEETVWDGGVIYVPPTTGRIHDAVSTSASDVGTVISSGVVTSGDTFHLLDSTATFISDGVSVKDLIVDDSSGTIACVTEVTSETQLTTLGFRTPDTFDIRNNGIQVGDAYRVVTNGSTGVSVLHLDGLSETFEDQHEFIVLNGTTNVATARQWYRVNRGRLHGSNTTGSLGTVSLTARVDGTLTSYITPPHNHTLNGFFSVPLGKDAYIGQWFGEIAKKKSGATIDLALIIGDLLGIPYTVQERTLSSAATSTFSYAPFTPLHVPELSDVWINCLPDTTNVASAAGLDMILVDHD